MISLLKYTLGIAFVNVVLTNNDVVIPFLGQANDTKENFSINKPCGLNQLLEKVSDILKKLLAALAVHTKIVMPSLISDFMFAFSVSQCFSNMICYVYLNHCCYCCGNHI